MHATLRSLAVPFAGLLGACLPPPLQDCTDTGCTTPATSTSGDPILPTTSNGDEIHTVTGNDPTTDPTDRSTPPLINTMVMPMDTIPTTPSVRPTLRKLSSVRKYCDCEAKMMQMIRKVANRLSVVRRSPFSKAAKRSRWDRDRSPVTVPSMNSSSF